MEQPFKGTWWVNEGRLLAGCFPGTEAPTGTAERLTALVAAGIRTFICLQPAHEVNRTNKPFAAYEPILRDLESRTGQQLEFHRFPITDNSAPAPAVMVKVVDAIDKSLAEKKPVYVHCWGGHGRTGTVVGCWLVRHGKSGPTALKTIKELRDIHPEFLKEPSPQTGQQIALVRDWAKLDSAIAPGPDPSKPAPQQNIPMLIGVEPLGLHDRYLGAMFGLAVGDAIGTTVEFSAPGTFPLVTEMTGGGPFGLEPGQWTDDTSMALCLAESLIHCMANDANDQMLRYVAWWKAGHLSSTGKCFDIGGATSAALSRFMTTGDPLAGSKDPHTAGNGSLMRLAPIPLAFRANMDAAVRAAAQSSATTHAAVEAIDACRFMTVLMIRALAGASKNELLHETLWETSLQQSADLLAPKVLAIARGSYKATEPPEIRGRGYVVDCLEASLWAFHHHDNYKDAVLAAVNLGDDADTTAAVCGQLAGAHYGLTGIPGDWTEKVAMRDAIAQSARGLLVLSKLQESAMAASVQG